MIRAVRVMPAAFTVGADGGQRAAQDRLVGPSGAVDHGHRHVRAEDGDEVADDAGEVVDREVDAQGRTRGGERLEVLACRHGGGAHGGAGHDDRLGDVGQGQLAAQGRRGGREGRHAGGDRPGDAERVEAADLLGDGAVERGVAGMDAGNVLALGVGGLDLGHDLVEMHGRRVDHAAG